MKQFPALYKRAKTGKIQEWIIEVEDATDNIDGYVNILIHQGQLGGKKQTYVEQVLEGKQRRDRFQQGVSQAESRWKKKKDEGYKSLQDLGYDEKGIKYWQEEKDNKISEFTNAIDLLLPTYNTDSSGNIKPMLAQKYEDCKHKLRFPCLEQPKLNGVRCLAFLEEENDGLFVTTKVKLLSRDGKEYKVDHIQKDLLRMFEKLDSSIVFDGEIYSHNMPLNQIVAAVKKPNENTPKLGYYIYDLAIENVKQWDRNQMILMFTQEVLTHLKPNSINNIRTTIINSEEEIIPTQISHIKNGYEGMMLRNYEGRYAFGSRSKDLLKVKSWKEEEFEIIGYRVGSRGVQDLIFKCRTQDGVEFDPVATGTIQEKQELYDNIDDLIGKKATVKFFEYTEYGTPFHGHVTVIRDYD